MYRVATFYRRAPWLDRVTGIQWVWLTGEHWPLQPIEVAGAGVCRVV
jgi:hypothetical protein